MELSAFEYSFVPRSPMCTFSFMKRKRGRRRRVEASVEGGRGGGRKDERDL